VASNVSKLQSARRDAQKVSRQSNALNAYDSGVTADSASAAPAAAKTEMKSSAAAPMAALSASRASLSAERRGWNSWVIDGRIHMLGWV
jgi:hypothetical protein